MDSRDLCKVTKAIKEAKELIAEEPVKADACIVPKHVQKIVRTIYVLCIHNLCIDIFIHIYMAYIYTI